MGLIHIYCGDGKGKTTAALGLALRAAGSGMRVHIVQLLKGAQTSEIDSLALVPQITVARPDRDYSFTFSMSEEDKALLIDCHNRLLTEAQELIAKNAVDMLIIDEFNAAYAYGYIDRELARSIVLSKPEQTELILTGRDPDPEFTAAADYVSEILAVKHPYSNGIQARRGIEY